MTNAIFIIYVASVMDPADGDGSIRLRSVLKIKPILIFYITLKSP